jgi:PPOX class probable F420-dependent enzyme
MDTEALQAFLAQPHEAIIATNRAGKGPQLTPVWFVWDGESFLISMQKGSAKYANIARDPNISLIINNPVTHSCVTAYGRAEIVEPERYPEIVEPERYPELWDALAEKYIPSERREQFIAGMQAIIEPSVRGVIALKPEQVIGRTLPVWW